MTTNNVYRFFLTGWLFVVICAVVAVAGIEFSPSSNMRFWNIRSLLFQILSWCLLVNLGIILGFLVIRKLIMSVVTVVSFLLLFTATLMVGLTIGPSIESVHTTVASAIGITPSELICIGGNLRRESIILFQHKGAVTFDSRGEPVSETDQETGIVLGVLERMNLKTNNEMPIKVRKFPLEFDTIYCVICGKEQWVVFFGNSVM